MDQGWRREDLECAISEEPWSSDEEEEQPPKTQDPPQGQDKPDGQSADQAAGPSQPKKQDQPKKRTPGSLLKEDQIQNALPVVNPREELQINEIVHSSVTCDVCKQPVAGVRFKCQVCPNYNLCDWCETTGHHGEHDMLAISFPLYIRPACKEEFDLTVHEDTTCDVCKSFPIRGIRYKCMQCQNYDLCQKCERDGKHSHHDMCVITYPLWRRPGRTF